MPIRQAVARVMGINSPHELGKQLRATVLVLARVRCLVVAEGSGVVTIREWPPEPVRSGTPRARRTSWLDPKRLTPGVLHHEGVPVGDGPDRGGVADPG